MVDYNALKVNDTYQVEKINEDGSISLVTFKVIEIKESVIISQEFV